MSKHQFKKAQSIISRTLMQVMNEVSDNEDASIAAQQSCYVPPCLSQCGPRCRYRRCRWCQHHLDGGHHLLSHLLHLLITGLPATSTALEVSPTTIICLDTRICASVYAPALPDTCPNIRVPTASLTVLLLLLFYSSSCISSAHDTSAQHHTTMLHASFSSNWLPSIVSSSSRSRSQPFTHDT